MITLGIILLVVGAIVALIAGGGAFNPRGATGVGQLGYIVAVIGVVLIVLGIVLELVDEADDNEHIGAAIPSLPLLGAWAKDKVLG